MMLQKLIDELTSVLGKYIADREAVLAGGLSNWFNPSAYGLNRPLTQRKVDHAKKVKAEIEQMFQSGISLDKMYELLILLEAREKEAGEIRGTPAPISTTPISTTSQPPQVSAITPSPQSPGEYDEHLFVFKTAINNALKRLASFAPNLGTATVKEIEEDPGLLLKDTLLLYWAQVDIQEIRNVRKKLLESDARVSGLVPELNLCKQIASSLLSLESGLKQLERSNPSYYLFVNNVIKSTLDLEQSCRGMSNQPLPLRERLEDLQRKINSMKGNSEHSTRLSEAKARLEAAARKAKEDKEAAERAAKEAADKKAAAAASAVPVVFTAGATAAATATTPSSTPTATPVGTATATSAATEVAGATGTRRPSSRRNSKAS